QDQHHEDDENADGEREIAALQNVADFTESGKTAARRALTCRHIDHGSGVPPGMAPTGAKRLRGGRRTTVSKLRHRCCVHGDLLPYSTRSTTLDFTRQILPGVWLAKS